MKMYTIKLDRKYVSGMSDECYSRKDDAFYLSNRGFHYANKTGVNKILFSTRCSDALVVEGAQNLKSWIDKIHARSVSGMITFKKMVIEEVNN